MVGTFDVLGSHGMVCRGVEGGGRRLRAMYVICYTVLCLYCDSLNVIL